MIITKGLINSAISHPDQLAIVDGEFRLTYQQFAQRVSQLQQALHRQGIQKGDRVALLLLNDFRYLELYYAVTSLGAIVVPLNIRLSLSEVLDVLRDSEPSVLFFHKEFSSWIPSLARQVLSLQLFILTEKEQSMTEPYILLYEEWIQREQSQKLTCQGVISDDVAGLFYTGGTTGKAKGVMLTHQNIVSNAYHAAIALQYNQNTKYVHCAPMFHAADCASTFAITIVGGTHYHIRMFEPLALLKSLEQEKPNTVLLVPTMLNMLVNEPNVDQFDCRSLQTIIYGASPMPIEVLRKAKQQLPHVHFVQGYGMSEASPLVTILQAKDHVISGVEEEEKRLASCGQPIIGVQVKIVDTQGIEVPVGEVGEIVIQGPNIMKGYWRCPEETQIVLRDDWYFSGDMGYQDEDHYIYIVDRKKDMIITGGENVYSVEVEQVLYTHPDVMEAVAIGVPDPLWGEAVKAIIVQKAESDLTEEEIILFCKERLAHYKVPKSVEFVTELPKSGAGKILKREIRQPYWQGQARQVN